MLKINDDSIKQGQRLKAARKLTLLSRRAFALKYQFNVSSYQAWEDGKYKKGVGTSHALKIIKALSLENIDCSLEWLLYGNGKIASRKKNIGLTENKKTDQDIKLKVAHQKKIKLLNNKLITAITGNKVEECRMLVLSGANLHLLNLQDLYLYGLKQNSALHLAARYAGASLVQMFVDLNISVEVRNRDYDTPLQHAAYDGNLATINKLLDLGAFVNSTNKEGTVPIMWAAVTGNAEAISLLIKRGALIHKTDFFGNTAAHWAAYYGDPGSIESLYNLGAYIDIKNSDGRTPLDIAISNGHNSAVEKILQII